jgi:HSP20 family protein
MTDDGNKSTDKAGTPLERLRHELDCLLESAWNQGSRAIDTVRGYAGRFWTPPVDVLETKDSCVVTIDLPGCDPAVVDVSLLGNMLTVKGSRGEATAGEGSTSHRHERPHGPFCRSIPLPAPVDPARVVAESRHGVLTIQLSKVEAAKPHQIKVATRSGTAEAPAVS